MNTPWLLLLFTLPSASRSERVEVWRRLKRIGALPLGTSGYLLPNNSDNLEHFQWLAALVRSCKGTASVVQVAAVDDQPDAQLIARYNAARRADYERFVRTAAKLGKSGPTPLSRLRKRLADIESIDFFKSPARARAQAVLDRIAGGAEMKAAKRTPATKEFQNRIWITRPRPKIDRVFSAWLITHYIDPAARFAFAESPDARPDAVPFDMYGDAGFGHRGNDCTFETLCKEFGIRDRKVKVMAEMVHDADLKDGHFGRTEGLALLAVLQGWAQAGVPDEELLVRGMELADGVFRNL
jgi:hypothetical protein